jgi:cell division protein FtsL
MPRCYKQGTKSAVGQFCTGGCEEKSVARVSTSKFGSVEKILYVIFGVCNSVRLL